jgi:hypothetical protein
MLVNAISVKTPSFRASEEERKFAALDDSTLRQMAWNKAYVEVNDKRHNRIDKAFYYSLPLIGGISSLAQKMDYVPFRTGNINKTGIGLASVPAHKLRTAKLAKAGVVTGAWTVALGAISALWGAKNIAEKKIDSVREFNKEHPVLTTVATIAASFGAVVGANRLSGKIVENFLLKDLKGTMVHLLRESKLDKALNNNKILNTAEKFVNKMPPALKDIGKTAVDFLPWIAIGTQIAHSWGHQSVKLDQANKNYAEIKKAQQIVRQDIVDEKIAEELDDRM